MVAAKKSLSQLRKEVDALNGKLLALLSRRARLAQRIGEAKSSKGRPILDLGRERAVIRSIRKANTGPLSDDAVEAIFREIISACRASEEPTTVAFLGPEGTFTHAAAAKQFGQSARFHAVESIAEVFAAVEAGRARFGVVPVENTTEGAVTPTLDALAETQATILGEILVKVEHFLMATPAASRTGEFAQIASHPQVLAQCRRYLAENHPGVPTLPTASSAVAAKLALEQPGTAAIGSRLAARLYGLQVVESSIQDHPGNVTRFLVIGLGRMTAATGEDRTSLVISVKDEVGVLERLIRQFSRNKVNLSMIESRPLLGRPWEYRFFIDVSGYVSDDAVARALKAVDKIALSTKVLGSYPVAE